jgi:hypothetical protein
MINKSPGEFNRKICVSIGVFFSHFLATKASKSQIEKDKTIFPLKYFEEIAAERPGMPHPLKERLFSQ